jgi:hypothetical protein
VSGDGDLQISEESARLITQGLRGAIGELKGVASTEDAEMGAGFGSLSMTGMEAGDPGLADDFGDFCDRWEWGVRALLQNASGLAGRVGLAAGTQWEEDQYLQGTFKVVVNAAVGDPHATDDQVARENWHQVLDPGAYEPDYGTDSGRTAVHDMGRTWRETGEQVSGHGIIGALHDHLPGQDGGDG